MNAIRPPAVAGTFYPREETVLAREVREFLDHVDGDRLSPGFPKVVIAPHAGYIYSGAVAAHAYDLLRPARGIVRRVLLLGPCHRVPVRGLALPGASAFDTPLGRVPIDAEAATALRSLPQVIEMSETHAQEHGLEVQLPFLQQVLGRFSLVPFVVGAARAEEVAQVLEQSWGGEETLVVISSDLSHYLPYHQARAVDEATANAILGLDVRINHEQACGATPIAGALLAAKRRGLAPRLLDLRNSGDTAGGKSQVVGYGSFAFESGQTAYGPEHGEALLSLARSSIGANLGLCPPPRPAQAPWLREHRASFVTLKHRGELRGCVGMLDPARPLGEDVIANARAAAFQDQRFAPLTAAEFAQTELEVSVLSRPARIDFEDHADLVRQIVPGKDGLILERGDEATGKRGTFLPQVWEGLPDTEQFLAQLKRKAGLSADTRTTGCRFKRYRVLKWCETGAGQTRGTGRPGES